MNKQQYKLLKSAFLGLKRVHKIARLENKYLTYDLNYYSNIVENYTKFKDFDIIQKHILGEIGGL